MEQTLTPAQLGRIQRLVTKLNAASHRAWNCRNRRRKLYHGRRAFAYFHKAEAHITLVPLWSLTAEAKKGEPSYGEA